MIIEDKKVVLVWFLVLNKKFSTFFQNIALLHIPVCILFEKITVILIVFVFFVSTAVQNVTAGNA